MRYVILTSILLLQGCTLWDVIKPSSGISVDTEIVAGDKHQEVAAGAVVGKKENTTNTAETITQTYNTIQSGKSIWDNFLMMLMSFLVGWLAMPSTRQMWLMVRNFKFKQS